MDEEEKEELQSQIQLLRERRRSGRTETEQQEKKSRPEGIGGVMTTQAILVVLLLLIYMLIGKLSPAWSNGLYEFFHRASTEDFSFGDQVYKTVSEWLTYLNQAQSADAKGGEAFEADDGKIPQNATFAAVMYTGSASSPLKQQKITSDFGFRKNPFDGSPDFHNAMDIAAPEGTPIYAVTDGIVKTCGENPSLGFFVVLDHGNSFSTTYAHCSKLLVREGLYLREGEQIALVGSTGDTTGPHLHFAACKDGIYFNPICLFDRWSGVRLV